MNNVMPLKYYSPHGRSDIDRFSIGFDQMFASLHSLVTEASGTISKYPPYNILRNEDEYTIEIAVAGFSKEDVEITKKDRALFIEGSKDAEEKEAPGMVIHRGIAQRDFSLSFALAAYVEVVGATMEDGVLVVELKQEIPEEKKPKVIEIK